MIRFNNEWLFDAVVTSIRSHEDPVIISRQLWNALNLDQMQDLDKVARAYNTTLIVGDSP